MLNYPAETTITSMDSYVLLTWEDANGWRYRVNRIVRVRGVAIDAEFIGAGRANSRIEAEDAVREVHRLALRKEYAVD